MSLLSRAEQLMRQGQTHFFGSRHREARNDWAEALRLFIELRHDGGIVAAAECVAGAAYYLSDYRATVRYARLSLRISRRYGDKDRMSRALTLLGAAAEKTGDLPRGLARQEQSLRLARELEDDEGVIRSLINRSEILKSMARYTEAVESIQSALRLLETRGDTRGRAWSLAQNTLGSIYRVLGENDLADEAFDCARECAGARGDRLGESAALTNLSIGDGIRREWEKAAKRLERSVELKRSIKDRRGEAIALQNLARSYTELGRLDDVLRILADARALAISVRHREGEWTTNAAIARTHLRLGNLTEARRWTKGALELAQNYGSPADAAIMQIDLARVLLATGDHSAAATLLAAAVDVSEDVRENLGEADAFRISLFEHHVGAYEDLQWVLAALDKTVDALEVAERGCARALTRALARHSSEADTAPDVQTIRAIAEELNTTFVVFSLIPDPRARVHDIRNPEIFTWVVPPDREAEIVFHRSGLVLATALASADGAILKTSVETRPQHKRHFVESQEPDLVEEHLRQLHDLLIAPIEHALPKDPEELVTIVASGELLVFPFAAMLDEHESALIERHTIAITPSIQTLLISRRRRPFSAGSRALIVANPSTDEEALYDAESEADAVAKTFDVTKLLRDAATRDAVLSAMPDKHLLHFATHGTFDAKDRARHYGELLLTGGSLTAAEISGMKLEAGLAVLSACNTGQGRIAAEGLLGLSRAFMLAGVPTVIATLWSIPDEPTAELMTHFYEHVHDNRARALRKAMLHTIAAGYRDPYDWAGFVLIGYA